MPINVFGSDGGLVFLFRKAERIAAAVHLVTSALSDADPIKWKLRSVCLSLVSEGANVSAVEGEIAPATFERRSVLALELHALLEIAYLSRLISESNFTILEREIYNFTEEIGRNKISEREVSEESVHSENFFSVPPLVSPSPGREKVVREAIKPEWKVQGDRKGHSKGHRDSVGDVIKDTIRDIKNVKDIKTTLSKKAQIQHTHTGIDRAEAIVELLRQKSPRTIAQFVNAVPGCSVKTIQRIIVELIGRGVVRREGVKRWSLYFLTESNPSVNQHDVAVGS